MNVTALAELRGSSLEKLSQVLELANQADPGEDEQAAQRAQLLYMLQASGAINAIVPSDPGEFDQLLLAIARAALSLRSDDAPAAADADLIAAGELLAAIVGNDYRLEALRDDRPFTIRAGSYYGGHELGAGPDDVE